MTQLEPCPQCQRHIEVRETACPFCARDVASAFANLAPRFAPRTRLGRAAVFAFGVVAACGDNTKIEPPTDAAMLPAPDAEVDGGGVPIYAAAPTPDKKTDTSQG